MADTALKNGMDEFMKAYTALYIDLPFAGMRMGLGMGGEKEATEAAWKSYDATVKLTSTVIDGMYRNPVVGEMTATTLDSMLRWQKANTALTGAFFTSMWKSVGLPTAGEIQALGEEVRALAERRQPGELYVKPKVKPAAKHDSDVIQLRRKVA